MNQRTCYLFEYKHNQKIRNVGFVKLQQQGAKLRFHINARGMLLKNEEILQFHVFYIREDQATANLLGQVRGKSGGVNCMVDIEEKQLPKGMNLEDLDGIILKLGNQVTYVAVWENITVNLDDIKYIQVPEATKKSEPEVKHTQETKCTQEVKEEMQETNRCKKIERQDISKLPRKEWKLANNSFLLHGYYNYHHLIFLEECQEEEEILWLGVPGVFHTKEQTAAKHFGFPNFKKASEVDLKPEPGEDGDASDFGYWCRQIYR